MPVDELEQRFLAMADLLAIEAALALAEGILIEEHKAGADHMRTAMASRATIEMAKGVLMA